MNALNMQAVFAASNDPPMFLTDSDDLRAWLACRHLDAQLFADFREPRPAGVVFIPTRWEDLPRPAALRDRFRGTPVLWVPLASFDARPDAAIYSLELLMHSDFSVAVANNRAVMMKLLAAKSGMEFNADGTHLSFSLEDEVYVNSRTRVALAPAEHASIGAYFEVELGANWVDQEETFHVNGELLIRGALASHHREMPAELSAKIARADDLLTDLRTRLPLTVQIEDSRVVPGAFGDLDAVMRELTNPMYDGLLTELAFGTNTAVNPHVDWSFNSQFNEGMGGIHIALGDGLSGVHLDFICPDGELTPV